MKKRNYWSLLAIMMVAVLCVGFVSCGDDDDEGGNGGNGGNGGGKPQSEVSALHVTSACGYNYTYDDAGRLESIDDSYDFSYNPNKITGEDGDYTVGYNNKGFLSSLKGSESYDDYYERGEYTESATLSYDGSGHLIKIEGSYKDSWYDKEDRKNYSYTGKATYTLTWSNNLLQKVSYIDEGKDSDGPFKDTDTYTLTYDNTAMSDYANKWLQYGFFAGDIFGISDVVITPLFYVGLLGNGPAYLPSSMTDEEYDESYEDGDKYTYDYTYNYNYRYTFNGDGSIKSINWSNDWSQYTYQYTYGDAYIQESAAPHFAKAVEKNRPTKGRHSQKFLQHRQRRNANSIQPQLNRN